MYVENPLEHVGKAIKIARSYCVNPDQRLLDSIAVLNQIICDNDLPEFYDPIQSDLTNEKVDSYSFSSIMKFLSDPENRRVCGISTLTRDILKEFAVIWLGRVVSVELLSDIIWVLLQEHLPEGQLHTKEGNLLAGRTK